MEKNNEIVSGFGVRKTYEGIKDYDKYYITKTVKKVVVKTGDTEDDYKLVDKVTETKTDIRQSIQAERDNAGIDAYLQDYIKTGTPLPTVSLSDNVQDFTNLPSNLAEASALGDKANKLFKSLDPKLTQGKTLEEFLTTLTQQSFNDYLNSFLNKTEKKVEESYEVKNG